jgi:hypothetical protein
VNVRIVRKESAFHFVRKTTMETTIAAKSAEHIMIAVGFVGRKWSTGDGEVIVGAGICGHNDVESQQTATFFIHTLTFAFSGSGPTGFGLRQAVGSFSQIFVAISTAARSPASTAPSM